MLCPVGGVKNFISMHLVFYRKIYIYFFGIKKFKDIFFYLFKCFSLGTAWGGGGGGGGGNHKTGQRNTALERSVKIFYWLA